MTCLIPGEPLMANTRLLRYVVKGSYVTISALIAVMLFTSGCAQPEARLRLHDQADTQQQPINLISQWAYSASSASTSNLTRILLQWPLPGSHMGQKEYVVYLQVPQIPGEYAVGESIEGTFWVSGFFIQYQGRNPGLTPAVDGKITIDGNQPLQGSLDLHCADGTEIVGSFLTRNDADNVTVFEQDHRADIADARQVAQQVSALALKPEN